MSRRKPILSKKFEDQTVGNTVHVVRWLLRNLSSNDTEQSPRKDGFERLRKRWTTLWAEEPSAYRADYQTLVGDLRSWIEQQLTDEEQRRLRNAVRQHRYQQRQSKNGRVTISIRVDRLAYEAATSGLPDRQRGRIVARLLERFAKDESLRRQILASEEPERGATISA
jgi:hypothetical protein